MSVLYIKCTKASKGYQAVCVPVCISSYTKKHTETLWWKVPCNNDWCELRVLVTDALMVHLGDANGKLCLPKTLFVSYLPKIPQMGYFHFPCLSGCLLKKNHHRLNVGMNYFWRSSWLLWLTISAIFLNHFICFCSLLLHKRQQRCCQGGWY